MHARTVLDGRYVFVEVLGAGGFGQVWKAHDSRVDRMVAVKVLTGEGPEPTQREIDRLAREASVVGGLTHPNIVTVHDFGTTWHDGRLLAYLVMELLDGEPLSSWLESGALSVEMALQVASRVSEALQAAHQAGLVHRDVKPSNIVLTSDTLKVVDFGISKSDHARHQLTTTGVIIGSPTYMAPECFRGDFDARSDLYSLGCVLHEMLTGQPPFNGASWQLIHQHLHEPPPPLGTVNPDTPPELDDLLGQLLAKDPSDRPASARKVSQALFVIEERYFGKHAVRRGAHVESEVTLSWEEARDGAVIPIRLTSTGQCTTCAGLGFGCPNCQGSGQTTKAKTLRIRIPAGVREGQQIRIPGHGAAGQNGGAPGDLFVNVRIER